MCMLSEMAGKSLIPRSMLMNRQLTLGSLFDGSGTFPAAGILSGIQPIWASEIEPFCIRVTTRRLSFIKHLGDINLILSIILDKITST